jgi:hypothetical protein
MQACDVKRGLRDKLRGFGINFLEGTGGEQGLDTLGNV